MGRGVASLLGPPYVGRSPTNRGQPWTCRVRISRALRRKASLRKTLLHAAGLALVLVPLGSVAVQTAPISCGFGGSFGYGGGEGGSCQAISNNNGTQTNRFNWGDYFVEITLKDVVGDSLSPD